jgi:periplasmic protein TonB
LDQYRRGNASNRLTGWAVVVVLHLLIGWALVSGTAKRGLEFIKKPLEAVVIQEVIIPPPPPPPPQEIKRVDAPKVAAPPPPVPFIAPPEVTPPVSAAPQIAATTVVPEAPPVIAPPPPPAPPAAPVVKAAGRAEIGVICPTQVKPDMPRRARQDGTEGVVRAQALIRDGVVREVTILSGPRVFHAPVREAMLQYKCSGSAGEVLATQEFVFRVE